MTERGGRISRVDPATGAVAPVIMINEVQANGEGGLLGIALHPDFATVPEVFVAYDYMKNGSYTGKIVKYTYNGSTLLNPVVLLDNLSASSIHNGCRLVFSPDKKLFISTGDASVSSRGQDRNSFSGKILRINPDGSIPSDNPVAGSPVWTLGHRNPQGLVFVGDRLYSSEHGATTDDEINIISRGRNYGWPNVEGFCNEQGEKSACTSLNVVEPIYAWTPTIAPSGLTYYDNDRISRWKNSLLLAVLKGSVLIQLKLDGAGNKVTETHEFYTGTYGRLRDVCVSPEGKVFMITSNGTNDKLVVIDKK
jgi:glucose/arabinose dehydrogenase